MKTVIVYYSKHGTTQKVAHLIGEALSESPDYISLKEHHKPDIQIYDKVILGTSIYAGKPSKVMHEFCLNNRTLLEQKTIGLFICCMDNANEIKQMEDAYPEYLHKIALVEDVLGGAFLFDKMNFFERFVTKRITKINASVSNLRFDSITSFSEKMK